MLPQRTEEETEAQVSTVQALPPAALEGRRLGIRIATTFSVLVTRDGQRTRARAAELSTTGVVLDFRHSTPCSFDGLVTLDLMLPGLARPIRAAARLARNVRKLVAFEFMIIGRDDRLSIAEYIDRVRSAKS
jgi:hypothetical protein